MVSSVYWEWSLFLQAIRLGVKLTLIYDGIRIFRILIRHRNLCTFIEDLCFWIYAGVVIFKLQLEQSNGMLRGFCILGMLLGMYLYNRILGEYLVKLAEKGSLLFKRRLTSVVKMFKIKSGKQCDVSVKNRRKHGKK